LTYQRLDDDALAVLHRFVLCTRLEYRCGEQQQQKDEEKMDDEGGAKAQREIIAILPPDSLDRG
jgi:hypothetical protein